MAGTTGSGLAQSTDAITVEFARCWGYLGQLGVMASDMITRMEGGENIENGIQKITQLRRIVKLVEKTAQIEIDESDARIKKCNFFNRGFCSQGTSCKFEHPLEVCEQYEQEGICVRKKCMNRHLYSCRHYNSNSGCSRGELCSFSHRSRSRSILDEKEAVDDKCVVATKDKENHPDDKWLGSGQFGWLPEVRKHVAAKTSDMTRHGLKVQQVPCQELQDVVEKENKIDSSEATEEKDVYDDLIEAIKKGNGEIEDEMLDKILEGFENDNDKKVEELDDKMLDKILEGFETSDKAKKGDKGKRLKGGKAGTKKPVKKKVARGRGK